MKKTINKCLFCAIILAAIGAFCSLSACTNYSENTESKNSASKAESVLLDNEQESSNVSDEGNSTEISEKNESSTITNEKSNVESTKNELSVASEIERDTDTEISDNNELSSATEEKTENTSKIEELSVESDDENALSEHKTSIDTKTSSIETAVAIEDDDYICFGRSVADFTTTAYIPSGKRFSGRDITLNFSENRYFYVYKITNSLVYINYGGFAFPVEKDKIELLSEDFVQDFDTQLWEF